MELRRLLRSPLQDPDDLQATLSTRNLSLPVLHLIRAVHLELSLTIRGNSEIQRNGKFDGLFQVFNWYAVRKITEEEFLILYEQWWIASGIREYVQTLSAPNLPEETTHKLIFDSSLTFRADLAASLEKIMLGVTNYHNSLALAGALGQDAYGQNISPVSEEWLYTTEAAFALLDDDGKGYLNAENVMWFYLALLRKEIEGQLPVTIRKRVASQLEEMGHANGYVSLRSFKNYLLFQGLTETEDIQNLQARLKSLQNTWADKKPHIFKIPTLAQCHILQSSQKALPDLWQQAVFSSIPNNYSDYQEITKYMILHTYSQYMMGMAIENVPQHANSLLSRYRRHSSSNSAASGDPYFKVIVEMVQNYDSIINAVIEVLTNTSKPTYNVPSIESSFKLQPVSPTIKVTVHTPKRAAPKRAMHNKNQYGGYGRISRKPSAQNGVKITQVASPSPLKVRRSTGALSARSTTPSRSFQARQSSGALSTRQPSPERQKRTPGTRGALSSRQVTPQRQRQTMTPQRYRTPQRKGRIETYEWVMNSLKTK